MSPLAVRVGAGVLVLLALIALRGKRWAYPAFVVLGLLYFPAQTHFHVHVPKCEQPLPPPPLPPRPLDSRPPPPPVLSFLRAVSFRPRRPGVFRGCTYLRRSPRTFHRAQALSRQRPIWLRPMRSRRRGGRRSRRVQRSCNVFRRSWNVSGKCSNACG